MLRIPLRLAFAAIGFIVLSGCTGQDSGTADVDSPISGIQPVPAADATAPVIESFTSDAGAITRGESATLQWEVAGQTGVTIEPQVGAVNGSSIQVSPSETTVYTLTAANDLAKSSSQVMLTVRKGAGDWQVTEKPPRLVKPRRVDASKLALTRFGAQTLNCPGVIHSIRLKKNQDAVIHMSGNEPLRHPLWVTGGRNVRIVGLQIELATQPGCGIGELPNRPVKKHPNANIHPRVPGGIALRVQQSGVTFIEGLHIDVRGHQADCVVSRNPNKLSNKRAQKQRDVIVQNTYCSGVEGMGKTKIGNGVHGDFFQNQGRDIMRRLIFENVSVRSSQEGIVLHKAGSLPGAKTLRIRRYDYTWDPRYVGDDSFEKFGLAFDGWSGSDWKLEDVRIDDYRKNFDYIRLRGVRYGASSASKVKAHPEIRSGIPVTGAFALPSRTGLNYLSPHGGFP